MGSSHSQITPDRNARPAFTIIELIVVILIIVIISAILLPALGGARDVAKRTATMQLMSNLESAAGRFEQDNRRLPGYFSSTEMGGPDQSAGGAASGRGMSAMENIMLDLAGGILTPPGGATGGSGGPAPAPDPISMATLAAHVGPSKDRANQVNVDTALIGTTNGAFAPYFTPDNKNYQAQVKSMKLIAQNSAAPHADRPDKLGNQLPDLIDAFGTPILAWVQDDTATQPVAAVTDFARASSSSANRARFYWNSNACFLSATGVGKKIIDMSKESLLGTSFGETERLSTLTALLGNSAYPDDRTKGVKDILPTAARGRFVIHSAGANGIYLGKDEAGAKLALGSTPATRYLSFGLNFKNKSEAPHLDNKDIPTTIDVLDDFDDLIVSGGN